MAKENAVDTPFLFITPPSGEAKYFQQDLGVAYIQAYLKKHGIRALQYVPRQNKTLKEIIKKINSSRCRILGIKCYDTNYYYAKLIAETAKKEIKGLRVVFGGTAATFSHQLIMKDCHAVDACVRYEGECVCHELLKKDFSDWADINNLIVRKEDEIIQTPLGGLINNGCMGSELDDLPSPILSGIIKPDLLSGIITSRGCYYNCVYCNFSAMGRWTVRYHSVSRIIDELKFIDNCIQRNPRGKIKKIEFYDDAFTLNLPRAKEICRRIISENIGLKFFCDTRADYIDEELFDLMKEAGFIQINFGVESGVPKVLKTIKKCRRRDSRYSKRHLVPERIFLNNIKRTVNISKRKGFKTSVSIITGLPGETKKDALHTLKFVKSLRVDGYAHNVLRIFSGTELFRSCRKYGLNMHESEYKLPYIIHYPYNVHSIRPLPHAINYGYFSVHTNNLLSLYSGEYNTIKPTAPQMLYFESVPTKQNRFSELLKEFPIKFGTALFYNLKIQPNKDVLDMQKRLVEESVTCKLFTKEIYLISNIPKKKHCRQILFPDRNQSYKYTLQFGSLSHLEQFLLKPLSPFDILLFDVKNNDEFEIFRKIDKHPSYNKLVMASKAANVFFLDFCRWDIINCPQLCTKSELPRRLFFNNNGSISICAGASACQLVTFPKAPSFIEIRTAFTKLKDKWQMEIKKRGCISCVVNNRCSKCLNPYPLSIADFCLYKKTGRC